MIQLLFLRLRDAGWTVSTAESCTGGMVASTITALPGASSIYEGGVVSYSNELKQQLLGVPEALLAEHGAVSEPVARAMAEGAVAQLGSTCGIATTGIAGPDGGSPEKPVGLVFIAVTTPKGTTVRRHQFSGTRNEIQAASADAALRLLLEQLV